MILSWILFLHVGQESIRYSWIIQGDGGKIVRVGNTLEHIISALIAIPNLLASNAITNGEDESLPRLH